MIKMNNGLNPLSIPLNTKLEDELMHQNFIRQNYLQNNNNNTNSNQNYYSLGNINTNTNKNNFQSNNLNLNMNSNLKTSELKTDNNIHSKQNLQLQHTGDQLSFKSTINYDDYFNNLKRKLLASEKLYESKNESNFDTLSHLMKNNMNSNNLNPNQSQNFNNYISNEKYINKQSNLEAELKNVKKKKNYVEEKLKVNNDNLLKSEANITNIHNVTNDENPTNENNKESLTHNKINNLAINEEKTKPTKKDVKTILSDVEFD